jgi:hypothetical protein
MTDERAREVYAVLVREVACDPFAADSVAEHFKNGYDWECQVVAFWREPGTEVVLLTIDDQEVPVVRARRPLPASYDERITRANQCLHALHHERPLPEDVVSVPHLRSRLSALAI